MEQVPGHRIEPDKEPDRQELNSSRLEKLEPTLEALFQLGIFAAGYQTGGEVYEI